MKISGIYKIINKINGHYYVGSSSNINENGRLAHHLTSLNRNNHKNPYLQNAWNKYGKENFEFSIIEEVLNPNLLLEIEQKYLDIAKTEQDKCYNLEFCANGGQWSEASRNKMRGSNNHRYNPNLSEDYRNRGYRKNGCHKKLVLSEEHKQKLSVMRIGKGNPNYDDNSYNFLNTLTNEIFVGTKHELASKFNLKIHSVNALTRGRINVLKSGWKRIKET